MKILFMYLGSMLLGTFGPYTVEECKLKMIEQTERIDVMKYPYKLPSDIYTIECHDIEGAKAAPKESK